MGKLADLWTELGKAPPDEKDAIRKKINGIEQWCINNNFGNFKEITDWKKTRKGKKSELFGFTEISGFITVGNFILPMRDFCSNCGMYKDNGLISINGEMLHV
jgi:hypothetical protein